MSNLIFVFGVLIICKVLAPDTFIEDMGVFPLVAFVVFGVAFEIVRLLRNNNPK